MIFYSKILFLKKKAVKIQIQISALGIHVVQFMRNFNSVDRHPQCLPQGISVLHPNILRGVIRMVQVRKKSLDIFEFLRGRKI